MPDVEIVFIDGFYSASKFKLALNEGAFSVERKNMVGDFPRGFFSVDIKPNQNKGPDLVNRELSEGVF